MSNRIKFGILAATLLTACGGAVLAQTGSAPWAGIYDGAFKGGRGKVTVKGPNAAGRKYEVTLNVAGPGCRGDAYGGGDVKNGVLTAIVPVGNTADGWQECRVTLTREGGNLRVSESRACAELHGASCGFSGSLARAGGRVASAPSPRPLPREAFCPPVCDYNTGALAGGPRPAPTPSQTAKPRLGRWFYETDTAAYGPPNAGAYVILRCVRGGINVALMDSDSIGDIGEPDPARPRAVLSSGGMRFEAPTVLTETSLDFVVPNGEPILANWAANGFTVSFRNGERNPFPANQALARLVNYCRSKGG